MITLGGWDALQGAEGGAIAYIIIYLVMAYYVTRWNRGVLPVAAALAVLFMVIAIVAAPGWFARDKTGFDDPALEPGILGLLTLILIPVQLLLIAFALRGFNQEWNVEVEVGGGGESEEERRAREEREERARLAREQREQTAAPWELQQQQKQDEPPPGGQPPPRLATLDPPTRRCWNWHTGQAQNLLPLGACGFESHPPH